MDGRARRPQNHRQPRFAGKAEPAPALSDGTLRSPQFLGTEAEYFREARRLIESAKGGDRVALQRYEFENAKTNGDKDAAVNTPGYADQQALLTYLSDAADRFRSSSGKFPQAWRVMQQKETYMSQDAA